jgi:DNA-binding GntR family transcriptional regulator
VLEPGSRIDYVQLCASLGVSITPLREALRRLEADHLVIRNAHRDVVVAPLTHQEASDLVAVRLELDLLATRLAVAQMTGDELARARKLVARQDEQEALRYLLDAGVPVAVGGMSNANRAFHRMVYCGSHNQVLIQYRDAISTRTERYVILARQISAVPPSAHRLMHEKLLAALEARDAEAAADMMRAHYRELDLNFADVIFGGARLRIGLIRGRPYRCSGVRVARTLGVEPGGTSVMGAESTEALEVLRDVWRGQAQTAADLGDDCETHCRRMTDAGVGFDDYAGADEADRSAAWRARLEREGKLSTAGSLRDLILRPATNAH